MIDRTKRQDRTSLGTLPVTSGTQQAGLWALPCAPQVNCCRMAPGSRRQYSSLQHAGTVLGKASDCRAILGVRLPYRQPPQQRGNQQRAKTNCLSPEGNQKPSRHHSISAGSCRAPGTQYSCRERRSTVTGARRLRHVRHPVSDGGAPHGWRQTLTVQVSEPEQARTNRHYRQGLSRPATQKRDPNNGSYVNRRVSPFRLLGA